MADTTTQNPNTGTAEQASLTAIEARLAELSSVTESFREGMEGIKAVMTDGSSPLFTGLSGVLVSALQKTDADRRTYDEAVKQNEEAKEAIKAANGPQRGQAGFWEAAYAQTPKSQTDIHADALKKTLTDAEVREKLQESLNSKTIKEAVSKGDSRSFSEKAADATGIGLVSKLVTSIKDRDLRKEEKATKKDQDEIARNKKDVDRLNAEWRRKKNAGASEEDLDEIREKIAERTKKIKAAESRLDERKKTPDPYGDLAEIEGGIEGVKKKPAGELPEAAAKPAAKAVDGSAQVIVVNNPKMRVAGMLDNPSAPSRVKDEQDDRDKKKGEEEQPRSMSAVDEEQAAQVEYDLNTKTRPDFYKEGTEAFKAINDGELSSGIASSMTSGIMSGVGSGVGRGIMDAAMPSIIDKIKPKFFGGDDDGMDTKTDVVGSAQLMKLSGADPKEMADIERYLNTKLRPEFYEEGIKAFKLINSGKFGVGGEGDAEGEMDWGDQDGVMWKLIKNLPKVKEIVEDVELVTDPNKATENTREMHARSAANAEERKRGWNDDKQQALIDHENAQAEYEESLWWGLYFGDEELKKKVEETEARMKAENERARQFLEAAKKKGIKTDDDDALNQFWEEWNASRKTPGGAGNQGQSSQPTTETAGKKADVEHVETAEEKAAREEEVQFKATKRAMLDAEVREAQEEAAKASGKQINESLVGR